jgi:hypothetical protein
MASTKGHIISSHGQGLPDVIYCSVRTKVSFEWHRLCGVP